MEGIATFEDGLNVVSMSKGLASPQYSPPIHGPRDRCSNSFRRGSIIIRNLVLVKGLSPVEFHVPR